LFAGGQLDIEPLWAMTREARIIGIGEATHGTHEFRDLMNAVVRRAAEDERPLVVALEFGFVEGLALDRWVGGSSYAPDLVPRGRTFEEVIGAGGLYATEELRALFTWIRAYNATAAPGRAIRVAGVDVCLHPSCVAGLVAYLAAVDPGYEARARALLAPMKHLMAEFRRSPSLDAEARAGLAAVRARLGSRRDAYVAIHGESAHDNALRLVWLGERRLDAAIAGEGALTADRDWIMADTVGWIAQERPDARIIVLAHNDHLTRDLYRLPNGRLTQGAVMGREIARRFEGDYVTVRSTFGSGSFLAHHTRSTLGTRRIRAGALRVFSVEPAPSGTLEAALRGPGDGYVLNVRSAAAGEGALARYLRGWQYTRSYGYAWRRAFAAVPVAWTALVPAASCDVLVYFTRASAARPFRPTAEQ
jgi:erythromycin esterase